MWTQRRDLHTWVASIEKLAMPDSVYLCDGSQKEFQRIAAEMVEAGKLVALNPSLRPNSFWCASDVEDVARVEECTYICSKKREDAGPTNHWKDPAEMEREAAELFRGAMRGRTLYIVPYCMGPLSSPYSRFGVELTDSPYVVLHMQIMTRMGKEALEAMGDLPFVKGLHSVGRPLARGEKDVAWPCNPQKRVIAHFPEKGEIVSFGSGYGGNALLGKKCFALRIASCMARQEGWLSEHMLLSGITNPRGEKRYIAAAFPSACGKTNLAMLKSSLPGWKVETVGDDIAWIFVDREGTWRAINPERGYFGVAPGTSWESNPHVMEAIEKNAIFTNTALTPDKDVWWEGMGKEPPEGLLTWKKAIYDPKSGEKGAHPNARFTVAAVQNPIYDPMAEDPQGVPLSAILFGGRRSTTCPLVVEAPTWERGVFFGASLSSERTAAAKGTVGVLRHDPFAMLPFCGYNMGHYFAHWLSMGKRGNPPKIYAVNWFRKGLSGEYLWPGYGENIRVLQWILEREEKSVAADTTFLGHVPRLSSFSLQKLHLSTTSVEKLFLVDPLEWKREREDLEAYFSLFQDSMPEELFPLHHIPSFV